MARRSAPGSGLPSGRSGSGLLFDDSPAGAAAAGLTAGLLVLLGLMELVGAPGSAAAGLLAAARTRAPMLCTLASYWLLGAPLGLWLCEGAGLGITGVWTGLAAGTALSTALLLARLRRQGGEG